MPTRSGAWYHKRFSLVDGNPCCHNGCPSGGGPEVPCECAQAAQYFEMVKESLGDIGEKQTAQPSKHSSEVAIFDREFQIMLDAMDKGQAGPKFRADFVKHLEGFKGKMIKDNDETVSAYKKQKTSLESELKNARAAVEACNRRGRCPLPAASLAASAARGLTV